MSKKPNDKFEVYFTEKIWDMIPSIYRHEDGIAQEPGVLRAIVEVLAEQAAILRRSHDRLWEDQFIEFCSDWAVTYLADLVGTRLISEFNKRGRRVDAAKTIYYRRRKGTLRVLEELISDIAGWEGKVVENFRRLGRARHRLDPQPGPLAGRFSETMPGGWADLRKPIGAELLDGPFDEFHHTVDMRKHQGVNGRYGIPKLAFFLYRLTAFPVKGVMPRQISNERFTFDPSGRDIPLFMRRNRSDDWDEWHSIREWELPAPMRCRILAHAEYKITEPVIQELSDEHGLSTNAARELLILKGRQFKNESRLKTVLDTLNNSSELSGIYSAILDEAIVNDCGKKALLPDSVWVIMPESAKKISREKIAAGNLAEWSANISDRKLVIDPERGRFLFLEAAPNGRITVDYHYGFSAKIGAGTYDRSALAGRKLDQKIEYREIEFNDTDDGKLAAEDILNVGTVQLNDSATYGPISDKVKVKKLTLQAANGQRPYLLLESNWVLNARSNTNADSNTNAEIMLDGLWIGSAGDYKLILRNGSTSDRDNYEKVVISNCTLDPGGRDAEGGVIEAVPLVIEAKIEEMVIENSIIGPILLEGEGTIERLIIRDSIVQSADLAISIDSGVVEMERVTVLGSVNVHRLRASEALITGKVTVIDPQNGCFRFSAALHNSRLPKPYESYKIADPNHYFVSTHFGEPGYAQLTQTVPSEILRGAESGSEMGAFNNLLNPIKMGDLQTKIDEYIPFGLIPIFIEET